MNSGFLDKLIERIGRIGAEEVSTYLLRLAQEKGFLETIFNAIQEGIIVTDPSGNISFVNNAASNLFGLQKSDCEGKPLSERIRGLDWQGLVSSEQIVSRDMEIFYPQNRFLNFYIVPLSLELSEAKKQAPSLVGYALILRDITENRRSTEQTIESERFSALTLLAAGVAHEIGNPLNSLHIHFQLLERKLRKAPKELRAELEEPIGVAREEIKRLDYIVNQFLRAIRPTPLETQPENLNQLVQESVSFLAAEISDRDILVEQELRADLPLISVDRNQIKQAIYNVIRNSFQAMKSGGILHITSDMEDDFICLHFADTGGGISPENMSRIFDPYFTTKASGSGLGLLIVRRIVREHGGEIEIINHEGKGIELTIRLPFRDRRIRMLHSGGQSE